MLANVDVGELTPSERALRSWLLASGIVYALAIPLFLFLGHLIPPLINLFSSIFLQSWPLYPLPETNVAEGAFWRVLSVSMMAMLTWICVVVCRDVRRHIQMTPVILISKCCSTVCYFVLFAKYGFLVYLVGSLTDGPIFLLTFALWYGARAGDRIFDAREEKILAKVGNALMPRGGAFALGYLDLREECLKEARLLASGTDPITQVGIRLLLRLLNYSPVYILFRPATLLTLPPEKCIECLEKMEGGRSSLFRTMVIFAKALILQPFFNQPEAALAVGYASQTLQEEKPL